MSDTPNLKLPLVAAAQAQKHVTVNEALSRVDAALQLSVMSRSVTDAPAAIGGEVYLVPDVAAGAWEGQEGSLAFAIGSGWDFITPQAGWRLWVSDEAKWVAFDGTGWLTGAIATSLSGAGLSANVLEFDAVLDSEGATFTTSETIPEACVVFAVTGRVISGFDGSLTDWSLGVSGSDNRYGSGLGTATSAFVRGLTGQPQSYYADTQLLMTANGGDFGSGVIRFAVHMMQFEIPRL